MTKKLVVGGYFVSEIFNYYLLVYMVNLFHYIDTQKNKNKKQTNLILLQSSGVSFYNYLTILSPQSV